MNVVFGVTSTALINSRSGSVSRHILGQYTVLMGLTDQPHHELSGADGDNALSLLTINCSKLIVGIHHGTVPGKTSN